MLLFVGSNNVLAQPIPPSGGGGGPGAVSAPVVINISQYGAKCDSTTNDNTAINNAFSALRMLTQGTANNVNGVLAFDIGTRCLVNSINATGFTKGIVSIQQNGKTLYGRQAGVPVIDALGSIGMIWKDTAVICSADAACSYGIQIGRLDTTANNNGGSSMIFENLNVQGAFAKAACYNFAGETAYWSNPYCKNTDSANSSYGMVMDGANHFNITSAFVTELAPVDTCQSFNHNTVLNGHFSSGNTNSETAPLFVSCISDHFYQNTYLLAGGAQCITLYVEAPTSSNVASVDNSHLGTHCEGLNSPTDLMLVSGNQVSPVLKGLFLSDAGPQTSNSIFKLGGSATSATIQDLELHIPFSFPGVVNTLRAFDAPQSWTVSGNVYFGTPSFWNEPASWQGCVTLATKKWCYPDRPGPLDFLGNSFGAWSSARRLSQSYVGPIINIENNSTSATADVYASSDAVSSSAVAGLLATGATGNFITWYDQSGSATGNLTQATGASQPTDTIQLANLGKRNVAQFGDGTALAMPSASTFNGLFTAGGFAISVVNQTGTPTQPDRIWQRTNVGLQYIIANQACLALVQGAATSSGTWVAPALTNGGHVIDVQYNASSNANIPTLAYDGVSQTFGSNCSATTAQPVGTISADAGPVVVGNNLTVAGTRGFVGAISEMIVWKTVPAVNTLDAIRRNVAAFYGLTAVQ